MKTAFCIQYGHLRYQLIPFDVSNVPANLQEYMNEILAKKLDIFVIVYLNDILMYIIQMHHVDTV